ncbi:MAG TPA: HPF/RaiA family ribosome-associated protein [Nitrospira sp.]|nr:HPF/RaiA family ribosome-associated protein [Nitrospira sp.]
MRRSDRITARSAGRSLFPAWIPKPLKRQTRSACMVPAHIRVSGAKLNNDARAYMRDKLSRALGKFAQSIERVTVRMEDVNGPRGGIDQECRIKVVLINQPGVLVEARNAFPDAAFRSALARIERAVRRSVQRSRAKPRKSRARSGMRAA